MKLNVKALILRLTVIPMALLMSFAYPYDANASDKLTIWKTECLSKNINHKLPNFLSVTMTRDDSPHKRCEIYTKDLLALEEDFILEFNFTPQTLDASDFEWHSILQFHSVPDLDQGEEWRCPIAALIIQDGKLRMPSRWDKNKVSVLKNGTCASKANSIKSRNLFKDYQLITDQIYNVKIFGNLSYKSNGYLRVLINGKELANVTGPTAFNDDEGPYLKLGIYKPTSWKFSTEISYRYENFIFKKTSK